MDIKDLAYEKKGLCFRICQEIREFEQKIGIEVADIKINRDEQGIESVVVKIEMPE